MSMITLANDEQRMLRESVRRWADKYDARVSTSENALWAHFADMGWLAAGLPEDVGGLGGGAMETAIIAEEIGRSLVASPFVDVVAMSAQLLLEVAPHRVEAIAAGSSRPLIAHDEPDSRGDPMWVTCRAQLDGDQWRLTGRKTSLVGISHADILFVTARDSDSNVLLFELDLSVAPLRHFLTSDGRSCAELLLDGTPAKPVAVNKELLAGLVRARDYALVIESAEALGAMQRALEITVDYISERRQYGQKIGDFQALRHRIADMFMHVEHARSMVMRAIASLSDADANRRSMLACATKARVGQAAQYVGAQSIQLHGGIGLTEEYLIGHYFRRLLMFDQRHGSSETHVERFARITREASDQLSSAVVSSTSFSPL